MKIITCCKVVPDEEQIKVLPNRELALDDVPAKISQYDLNALEAAKKLSAETKGSVTALSVGSSKALDATKIRKDILSRGANDLKLVISDDHSFSDSFETAKALAAAIREQEEVDLVLCGTGSSDLYNQVTGIQLGTLLDWPTLNNVTSIQPNGDTVLVERTLENSTEVFEVALPAVLSVSSEINVPTVPAMRDIMQAGKKPVAVLTTDLGLSHPLHRILYFQFLGNSLCTSHLCLNHFIPFLCLFIQICQVAVQFSSQQKIRIHA